MTLDIVKKLPGEMSDYLPGDLRMENECLIMERPRDYSGAYSKTVQEYGRIENKVFWDHIDHIRDVFASNDLWFLDVFHHGNNIMVQKLSESEYKPIIIDFKRLGRAMYPYQFNLLLVSEQRRKFYRRFDKFVEAYKG